MSDDSVGGFLAGYILATLIVVIIYTLIPDPPALAECKALLVGLR